MSCEAMTTLGTLAAEQSDELTKLKQELRAKKDALDLTNRHYERVVREKRELQAQLEATRKELLAIKYERDRVASGRVTCEDCNAILARF
jgi:chromosome segregation ATPase